MNPSHADMNERLEDCYDQVTKLTVENERLTLENENLLEERDTAIVQLRNLLAVIHGDGGHYAGKHGIDKAVEDAQQKWAKLSAELDKLREGVKPIVEALKEIQEHPDAAFTTIVEITIDALATAKQLGLTEEGK